MAKRGGIKRTKVRIDEFVDYSTDHGEISPADLIAAATTAGVFCWDLETSGLDPLNDHIEGVAFYIPARRGKPAIRAWFPFVDHTFLCYDEAGAVSDLRPAMAQEETMEALRPLWTLPRVVKITANGKFDLGFTTYASGTAEAIAVESWHADSMLADFLANETRRRYGLKYRVKQVFGEDMTTYNEAVRGQSMLAFCNQKPLGVYAMDDCFWTYELHQHALKEMRKQTPARGTDRELVGIEKEMGRPLGKLERLYWGIDLPISRILMEMETAGCLIDWRHLVEVEERIGKEKKEIMDRIEEFLGWPLNPNAPAQVADALFAPPPDGLGLPRHGIPVGKSGVPSTGDKIIKHFTRFHPIVEDILKHRSLDTVETGFVTKLIKLSTESPDGRVRSGFNQTRTVIGRLSSSQPLNFQNQPREKDLVRRAFVAYRPGIDPDDMELTGGDYAQIELRMAAHLAIEKNMIEVYSMGGTCRHEDGQPCERFQQWVCEDGKCDHSWIPADWSVDKLACPKCGGDDTEHQGRCRHVDLHQRTAEDAQVKRNPLAKNLNFGTLYRMGAPKFSVYADLFDADGLPRIQYAREIIERWHAAYPGIAPYHDFVEGHLPSNNWTIQTICGRRRRLYVESKINRYRAVTQGIQFTISGSAQDLMKIGMVRVAKERDRRANNGGPAERKLWKQVKLLLQVHDEVQCVNPKAIGAEFRAMLKDIMENVAQLRVPLVFDVKSGQNWDATH